jgi:hypothetical protein
MTAGDKREPLWASSLADQPQRTCDAVPPEPDEAQEAPPRPIAEPRVGPRAVAFGGLAVTVMVVLAMLAADRGSFKVEDVPSFWEDIEMTCRTARLERDDRALEVFSCQAVRGGTLPPGIYRSPDAQWTSDLTRRDARANAIEISPDGELTGWATYW